MKECNNTQNKSATYIDSVPHERLLLKVKAYGIQGKVLQWIRSFLSGRKQAVVINGVKPTTSNFLSGVPQGSVIGSLLFLIYINDLPSQVSSEVLLFADDVKLYCPIVNQQSNFQMEQDLLSLREWSLKWLLNFNVIKSFTMHLGSTNPCHMYCMDGQPLQVVSEHKDLGVIVDSSLKFHSQATSVVHKLY